MTSLAGWAIRPGQASGKYARVELWHLRVYWQVCQLTSQLMTKSPSVYLHCPTAPGTGGS